MSRCQQSSHIFQIKNRGFNKVSEPDKLAWEHTEKLLCSFSFVQKCIVSTHTASPAAGALLDYVRYNLNSFSNVEKRCLILISEVKLTTHRQQDCQTCRPGAKCGFPQESKSNQMCDFPKSEKCREVINDSNFISEMRC